MMACTAKYCSSCYVSGCLLVHFLYTATVLSCKQWFEGRHRQRTSTASVVLLRPDVSFIVSSPVSGFPVSKLYHDWGKRRLRVRLSDHYYLDKQARRGWLPCMCTLVVASSEGQVRDVPVYLWCSLSQVHV